MKNSVIAALVSVALFAGTALAGEGPFVDRKVRGRVNQGVDVRPGWSGNWNVPLGLHKDPKDGAIIGHAGIYVRYSPNCPQSYVPRAMASPDLFGKLNGELILVPFNPMSGSGVQVEGQNDSGDQNMLYMCIQHRQEKEEWHDAVFIVHP